MKKEVQEFADYYQLLDSLIAETVVPDLASGDITARIVMERRGCHHQQALTLIRHWEKNGKVEFIGKRREPTRGQTVNAWRLKGNE
jgi:hypothetical protein